MNIALVYPALSVRERYGADIGEIGGRQAPLGILYLSSFLKKKGFNTIVIDASAENLPDSEVIRRIKNHNSKIVGISSTSAALRNSQRLADALKSQSNSFCIVLGGPHISSNPNDLANMPSFNFAIRGEGETVFAKFAESIEENSDDFSDIAGLIWRKENKIIINSKQDYIDNLDALPFPDRDALRNLRLYRPPIACYLREPVISIITSRGCPYQCVFCDKSVFGSKIRFFSPEYVIAEIELLVKKYNAKELAFVDDTFPCSKKRFSSILEAMLKKNFRLKWSCMANTNDLDADLLELMKKAGCWQIAVGIESGDDNILKLIGKKSNTSEIAKIAEAAHKQGIYVKGFFMLGHPGETKDSIEKTRKFALSIPLTDVTCTIATPIKGSEFYQMAASGKYGKLNKNANNSELNYWTPVFIPKNLTPEVLLSEQKRFFSAFYFRPAILFRQLLKIRSLRTLFRLLKTSTKMMKLNLMMLRNLRRTR